MHRAAGHCFGPFLPLLWPRCHLPWPAHGEGWRMRHRIVGLLAAVALLAAAAIGASTVLPAPAAHAAYPGANGRIAFEQGGVIYSIRPDGSDRRQLTTDTHSHSPRWSPNGRRLAFHRAGDIWVMRADG